MFNQFSGMGRLVNAPEVRVSQGEKPTKIARYTLAIPRTGAKKDANGNTPADFIRCVAFGARAEFAEKYFSKGQRVLVSGRIQTDSYQNKDGQTVYTTDVIVNDQEFADSKSASAPAAAAQAAPAAAAPNPAADAFAGLDGMFSGDGDTLPFN